MLPLSRGWTSPARRSSTCFYRVVALYAVAAAVSIIAGLERESRRKGLERERELQRQRIELSQTIHDTTAQWAYMVGLGVDWAMEMVDDSNEELKAKLRLVAELSRSAMWELRPPPSTAGRYSGARSWERSWKPMPPPSPSSRRSPRSWCGMGREPPLSMIDRSLLFSVAHNALTNVIRHAHAGRGRHRSRLRRGGTAAVSVGMTAWGCLRATRPGATGSGTCGPTPGGWGDALRWNRTGTGGGTTVTCVVPVPRLSEEGE